MQLLYFADCEAYHRLLQIRGYIRTRGWKSTGIQRHQLSGHGNSAAVQRISKRERAIADWRSLCGAIRSIALQVEIYASRQGL